MALLFVTLLSSDPTAHRRTESGAGSSSRNLPDNHAVVDWITADAVRLRTPEAGQGFADMQPLKKTIGDARIVSLGEATHGAREFFQLKHRMLEFLSSEMGFTMFAIEANMPEAYRLNDYVLNGNGDPKTLIRGMYFWTWDTQEVLDMVSWMRQFNKSNKHRLQFTGFDMQTPNVAADIVRGFVDKNDAEYADTVRKASDIAKGPTAEAACDFGFAAADFPVQAAAGKRIRYSGYVKTEGLSRGWAGLWWRVDGKSGLLAFDNMQDRGPKGTTDWNRYEIDLLVSVDAKNIKFGVLHTGDGSAWFDSLAIEVDGAPYKDTSVFDLDFESPTPKGLYTGGKGYQVQLDNQIFHSGKQSLRMKYLGTQAGTTEPVDPRLVFSTWQGVVQHLEGFRDAYAKKGVAPGDIEWVIQNAKMVIQSIELRANEVSRDRSMADNVKWILDNNPGAKIVLWAHNLHVSTASKGAYDPMGAALRKTYGSQMVVFGFAFNQGSFQAVEPGKELRDFTVPPAPTDSLDATFAAAGIPLFALDLRDTPKTGPVATWLNEPHKTRSIGASYSPDSAAHYLLDMSVKQSFDVMLFVEKTTAARGKP